MIAALVPAVCDKGHTVSLWGNPLMAKPGERVNFWGTPLSCGKCGAAVSGRAS